MLTRRMKALAFKADDLVHDYPRTFWVLMAGTFIDRVGGALIFPFLAVYVARKFNATMLEVGTVFAIFSISSVLGNVLAGAMTDRFGRRLMMVAGLVFSAVSSISLGLVTDLNILYGLAVIVGLLSSIGWPAQAAMMSDLLPEKKRADGFGIFRVVMNLAVAIGPVIGGLLAPQTGYLILFLLDASTSIVMAVITLALLPETNPQPKTEQGQTHPHESFGQTMIGYRKVLADRLFVVFAIVSMVMTLAYVQMYGTLSVYLVKFQNQPESTYGFILGMNALMVVLFQFPITRRISSQPPMIIMAVGSLLYMVGFSMYGFAGTVTLFALAMVIITIGEMVVVPISQALSVKFAPEDMRGRYIAIFGFVWIIPQAAAPLMAGWLMDNIGPAWVWYVSGLLGLAAAAGFYGLHLRGGARIGGAVDLGIEGAPAEPVAVG